MRPYLYLLFTEGGQLFGLEHRTQSDMKAAYGDAMRLLSSDRETRAVEIWSAGRLIDSVSRPAAYA